MHNDVNEVTEQCYTVQQLIAKLQGCDASARVMFVCDYGDHGHTQQALPVTEVTDCDTGDLAPTAYSHSGVKLVESDPEGDREKNDDETLPVVILQY